MHYLDIHFIDIEDLGWKHNPGGCDAWNAERHGRPNALHNPRSEDPWHACRTPIDNLVTHCFDPDNRFGEDRSIT